MSRKEYLLETLEDLQFKHMFLDSWIKQMKHDGQEMKQKKIEKLRMKEKMVAIREELEQYGS